MRIDRRPLMLLTLAALLVACKGSDDPPASTHLSVAELKDPETCKSCHPIHYREWKASMHAYASDDPVFLAMNELGHQETNGELGQFCVKCHAPLAVADGLTDGSPESLAALPEHMKGVSCYFCHNVKEVSGDNNSQVTLANDTVMRGNIVDAVEPAVHGVATSKYMGRFNPESSQLCGGCHDIVNDHGVHLERTYAEYKESIFAHAGTPSFLSCASCHMPNREGLAARDPNSPVGTRDVHSHLWPGVDTAVTDWPDRDLYEAAVTCALDGAVRLVEASSADPLDITYLVETMAGHKMPSGASQDRRLWVEMVAYEGDNTLCSLGAVPDDVPVAGFRDPIACDSSSSGEQSFPLFRDRIFDMDGQETHMFWRASPSEASDSGYIGNAMPAATQVNADGTPILHTVDLHFSPPLGADRVTIRMRMRPMDYDVLDELIEAGTLDPAVRSEIRTYTLATTSVEFNLDSNGAWQPTLTPERESDCYEVFFCPFDPEAPGCAP